MKEKNRVQLNFVSSFTEVFLSLIHEKTRDRCNLISNHQGVR